MTEEFQPLSAAAPLIVYFDIKSPYAFIAKDPTYLLADELGIEVDWRPLTLDIPSYLGSARLDKRGKVAEANRSPEQWGSVRYAYMDARRYAAAWGYGLRGTEKIWDTSLVHIGFSWVKQRNPSAVRRFLDLAYPRFWLRDLDVEDIQVVKSLIQSCDVGTEGFDDWAAFEGRREHDVQQAQIFAAGIYGVPGYICDQNYYFGREHLPRLAEQVAQQVAEQLAEPSAGQTAEPADISYSLPSLAEMRERAPGKHSVFLNMQQAAASGELKIIAGVNRHCPQTHLALKTLEHIQAVSENRVSVSYGEISAAKPANPEWLAKTPGSGATPNSVPVTDRKKAHRVFRAHYESTDLKRYLEWRNIVEQEPQEKSPNDSRFSQLEIDPLMSEQLVTGGVRNSFGFLFVDQDQTIHPFNGRQHLFLLLWAIENA